MIIRKRSILLIAVLLVLAGWLVWTFYARPRALYVQAKRSFADDPAHAADLLERAVMQAGGKYPDAQLLWTRALVRAGRWEEALGCFSLIEQPAELKAESLLALADEATAARIPLLAQNALAAVPERSSLRAEVLERQLIASHARGEWPAVVKRSSELTTLAPERPFPWKLLAEAYEHSMDPPQAATAYREFLKRETKPDARVPALRRLTGLSITLGDRADARRCHDELVTIVAPTVADRVHETKLLRLEGDLDAAWRAVNNILQQAPTDATALELRGTLAMDRSDYDAAERDLQALIKQQPWNKQAHYKLAQVLRRLDREEEAGVHFDENRRLTDLSIRILELQSKTATGQAEIDRLTELANAFEAIGQRETATALRQQVRQVPK